MSKFTSNNFLELLFANLVLNNDYVISKKAVQENLTDYYLDNHYDRLFKNISMHIDKKEAKKGNDIYYLDLEDAFKNALEQGQILEISSAKTPMYVINFSVDMARQLNLLYGEDEGRGKTYVNLMKILVKKLKVR